MFFNSIRKFVNPRARFGIASKSRRVARRPVRKSLIGLLLEGLEERACPSALYNYDIIAQTGQNNLVSISPGASINDSGKVAFVANQSAGQSVYVGDGSAAAQVISFASPSSNRTYGAEVQINDSDQVSAVDIVSGGIPLRLARIWNADSPGSNIIIARGSTPPLNNTYFDGLGNFSSISNDGQLAFAGLNGTLWEIHLSNSLVQPGDTSTLVATLTTPVFFRQMAANGGRVVIGERQGTTTRILDNFTPGDIASTANGDWAALGVRPGISDDGNTVAFYGDLTAAGAAAINAAQPNAPSLQPGQGIFASVPTGSGHVIIRVVGTGGQGGPSDVSTFDVDTRVAVATSISSTTQISTDRIVFMGSDSHGLDGIYENTFAFLGSPTNPTGIHTGIDRLIAQAGDSISGIPGTIQTLGINDPINNYGEIAFSVNNGGGVNAVVRAEPGYTPAQIRTGYGINSLTLDGTGQTVAIVDPFHDPNIMQDVDKFDQHFGVTSTSTQTLFQQFGAASSFLTVTSLDQNGNVLPLPGTDPSGTAEAEEALDVEWVHAIAPNAHIILVETLSSIPALMAGVAGAARQAGVSVVSMSFGFNEAANADPRFGQVTAADEALYAPNLIASGVTFLGASGDWGTADASYPAFSPTVVGVGGTNLNLNTDSSYNNNGESGWGWGAQSTTSGGSGGGLSNYQPEPSYQVGVVQNNPQQMRAIPDVSFVGDPVTGAAIVNSFNLSAGTPWFVTGGTSWSTPCWAALIALVNQGRAAAGRLPLNSASNPTQTLNALYHLSSSDFHDITSGNNGFPAGPGYDLVTGLGTPVANLLVPDLVAYTEGTWTGKGSNNLWSNPDNWSGHVVPSAGDSLLFPSGALQETSVNDLGLTFESITTADTYSFSGQALTTSLLDIKQGSLELACSATVSTTTTVTAGATLTVDVGNTFDNQGALKIAATGSLTVEGTVTVEGSGTLTDQGTVTVAAGGTLSDQGTVTVASGGTLTDQGTVTVASGATVTVASGGTLDDQGTLTIAAGGTMNDSGTLMVVGSLQAAGTLELDGTGVLDDQGSVTVAPTTGNLLDGGKVTVESGASLDDQGTVVVASQLTAAGTVKVESGALLSVGAAGTLGISGTATVASGGTLADQGTVTLPSGGTLTDQGTVTVAAGGSLTVDGTVSVAAGGTLDDEGTVKFEGFATLDDSGTVVVGSAAQLDLFANGTVENGGALSVQGTVTVGAVDTLADMGTVTVASGATLDDMGTVNVAPGHDLDDEGTVTVEIAAALHDSGTVTVASGAHLDLFAKVTVDGTLDDEGAVKVGFTCILDIVGPGNVQVGSGATLDINNEVTVESGATLDVMGTLTVEQLGILDDKGSITVEGTLDDFGLAANAVTVDVGATLGVSGQLIVESHAFLDIKGTVEIHTGGSLNDQGTVTVEATGLLSDQDAITVAAGATLDVTGHLTEGVGGALDVFGTLIIEPSATLDVFGTVTIEIGATYTPLGTVTVEPGGTLTILSQATPVIAVSTRSLNLGTTTYGTAGSAQSFTVSGSNLTADILLTAPSGVQLSNNGGTSYSTTLDLAESGGTVGVTTILARIAATAPVRTLSGMIAADSTGATEQDIRVSGTVNLATPTITWANPAAISYGTPLSTLQLDATASVNGVPVSGTFAYVPASGTVLHAGLGQTLSVTFTPDDTTDYTTATGSATIDVLKATPVVTVTGVHVTYDGNPHPAADTITGVNGDDLSGLLTLGYMPSVAPDAAPVHAGTYTATASFAGDSDYNPAANSATVQIDQATPVLNWLAPAAIVYGTSLGAAQLDAAASFGGSVLAGTFAYAPPAGTVLHAGLGQSLSALFTPADLVDFLTAPVATTLDVLKATPVVTVTGVHVTYDGDTHPATATIAGVNGDDLSALLTMDYAPSVSPDPAPVHAGTYTATASFAGDSDYNPAANSATVQIDQATPVLNWANPAAIVYGTSLGAAQLDAAASFGGSVLAGTFAYAPPAGSVLHAGLGQPLTAVFTPTDTVDFLATSVATTIDVLKATPVVTATGVHVTYDSSPHPATATITGVNGDDLSGLLSISYAPDPSPSPAPVNAGTYAVTASFPGTADYNAVTDTSRQVIIDQATPAFSGLSGPTIILGTPSMPLSGTISAGPLVPSGSVSITANAATQHAAIGAGGSFSSTFSTASLPAGSYTITYSYPGDVNFKAVSATTTLNVTYNVNPLFDQGKAHQSGSTIPIKLQLTDAAGNNVGSSDTPITALYVLDQNGNQVPLMDSGNSNPGDLFRFDPTTGQYIFNLKTTGYASGRYTLYFKVGNDPILHTVSFLIG
jgi:hypothetical protein